MEGTNIFVLFIIGFMLGCTLVMLLWMASPGCLLSQSTGGEGAAAGTSANLTPASGTPSSMVIRDDAGRTLATTGQRGTPSVFTDDRGNTRNLVCYMSYYCVDETPCDPCEEEECVQLRDRCGYWPADQIYTTANIQNQGTEYGDCCPPYECVDGYCSGEEECQQQYDICGLVYPTQTATAYNPNPVDYGDCCPPYECVNNKCGEEEQCVETGNTCGTTYPAGATANYPIQNGDCCPPDECINNVCVGEEPCVETGALCGYGPATSTTYTNVANRTWHGDCCQGNICTNGYCTAECEGLNDKCSELSPCCQGMECQGGVCRRPCVGLDQTCAAGQIECCDPYFCVSGKCAACQPGGYTCEADADCCTNYFCGDNKRCERATACMNENAECGKDSDCCQGLVCFDGTCKPEGVCGAAGQTCGLQVECCSGMECSENDVCTECAPVGQTCGGQYTGAGGLDCCSTGYCYSGICQQKADELCQDTENGPNYYTAGSATGVYQGDYGTYTDYCLTTSSSVVDYYCEVDGEYSEIQTAQVNCPQGCTAGACN